MQTAKDFMSLVTHACQRALTAKRGQHIHLPRGRGHIQLAELLMWHAMRQTTPRSMQLH
jgi:hypothetical protein